MQSAKPQGNNDADPPALQVTASPQLVWPPNGRLIPINVSLEVSDGQDPNPSVILESVVCDDICSPATDIVGANTGADDRGFAIRAKRLGGGVGRTYTATYRAVDASGNVSHRSVVVLVPHDRR